MKIVEKNKRDSNIELLRIVLILCVFIHHFNTSSIGLLAFIEKGTFNYYVIMLIENFAICSVNAFIILSAYYLCISENRKKSKVFSLIIETIVINILYYLLFSIKNSTFVLSDFIIGILPCNYFLILYVVLYLISPYINKLINSIELQKMDKIIAFIIIVFSMIPYFIDILESILNIKLMGLNPIGLYGSQEGYTIVNFVMLYFIGSYIRIKNRKYSSSKLLICLVLLIFILFVLSIYFDDHLNLIQQYNNPIIILMSAVIFLLFNNIKLSNIIFNHLSKPIFSFFLIHQLFFPYINFESLSNSNVLYIILYIFIVILIIYCASVFVYFLLYKPINQLSKKIFKE